MCAWSLFSQPHLASLLAEEKGFVGHFFSSFSAPLFLFCQADTTTFGASCFPWTFDNQKQMLPKSQKS